MSFFWATRFSRAHSRQKRWALVEVEVEEGLVVLLVLQATGSRAGRRQRLQLPKGRKESRVRRVEEEPHVPFSWSRS